MMKVPFLDLRITDETEKRLLLDAVERVFDHGRLVMGPELNELEEKFAACCRRKYAVGVSSGSDALFHSLRSLGIGPDDEVITTSLSWIATANAIAMTGATPVFADIDDDLNISPQSAARLITPQTRAIVPVHYTGKICRIDEIAAIAAQHSLFVVEDAAQAFKASFKGQPVGSFGDVASFSMNPMKVFAACGEAGCIVTDDPAVYDKLVSLRYNGTVNRETCIMPGLNGRMDTLQAAILLIRLERLNALIEKRRLIADWYNELLADVVTTPVERDDCRDVYYTYTIQADDRDNLADFLTSREIETKIQHPILMPDQPAYAHKVKGEFKNAARIVNRILSIPANEKITRQQVEYAAQCIREFYG